MEVIEINNNEPCLDKNKARMCKIIDAEVNFLPEIRQNILDLVHDLGIEGLNERDVFDLLEADKKPLAYEELIQLQAFDKETELVEVFLIFNQNIITALVQVGTECINPFKCFDDKTFAFCSMINGTETYDVKNYTCLDDQICSLKDKFRPCMRFEPPPTELETTTTTSTSVITGPPTCDSKHAGYSPAPKCNQYYKCEQTLWWWDLSLQTCPKTKAFDATTKKCVPIEQTTCSL
ncbi:hypothetical protein HHI36_001468 [Cryptolaemus montrouzieri]|uniref:Chitin-binding type-2 domain-containing protein n=1 Tax=Cryptolaemus montrouzieri TaxID=559131 RepID=A0ABD2P8A2_9CUCU